MEITMQNTLQIVNGRGIGLTNPNNIIEAELVDKPMIVNSFDSSLDPFTEIQKLPLSTEYGGSSKAHSIRMMVKGNDTELGVVKGGYLCVSNKEISEVGSEIRSASGMQWELQKVFFDGKVFRETWLCLDGGLQSEVPVVGDIVGLVMEVVNSYDSSTKAGILCYFMRLTCLNGNRSKDYQFGYSFRHTLNNELDWQSEINQSVAQLTGNNPQYMLNQFTEACGKLQKPIDFQELKVLSENPDYLGKLPTQQYGQIVRNMLVSQNYPQSGNEFTAWDLFNSGTEILWHQKKITQGAIKNNALVVDGILRYGKDTYDEPFVDPNQTDIFQS
tara:strand:- start:69 stop:1058 length:990 start_codon:yes stop_codon:yes gene_type:complete